MTPKNPPGEPALLILNPLQSGLLDLLFELRDVPPPLTVGGGFGLYLKRRHMEGSGRRTRIGPALWPAVRSTNDLDIVLALETLVDVERRRSFADALSRLGYKPIEESKYWQFAQPGDQGAKIDLLGGPLLGSLGRLAPRFQKDDRRWKPKSKGQPPVHLHARKTPEAVGVEDEPLSIPIEGLRSTGDPYQATVFLPQAFAYAMMKLFAFRDRKDDPDPRKDKGRHHGLDLYAVVAMMTEPEYDFAKVLRSRYADNDKVREAGEIVRQDFAGPESIGVLRLREHHLYDPAMDLDTFLSVLREIFA